MSDVVKIAAVNGPDGAGRGFFAGADLSGTRADADTHVLSTFTGNPMEAAMAHREKRAPVWSEL